MASRTGILVQPNNLPGNHKAVFNPAVHLEYSPRQNSQIHLFCRVVEPDKRSEIWQVILDDSLKISTVNPLPILSGKGKSENFGCEDPRMVEIDHTHYLTYTAAYYTHDDIKTVISLASSQSMSNFERFGLILPEHTNNKNGVLIGEKISGLFWLYHRLKPHAMIACSPDLRTWRNCGKVMGTRSNSWDNHHIGMGAPPLKTDDGWLCFYHGADSSNTYRIGVSLFDLEKPWRLLARSQKPLLEPEEPYEKIGFVPNVVFTCGAVEINDAYVIFYGGADRVVAAAILTKQEVADSLIPIYHSG